MFLEKPDHQDQKKTSSPPEETQARIAKNDKINIKAETLSGDRQRYIDGAIKEIKGNEYLVSTNGELIVTVDLALTYTENVPEEGTHTLREMHASMLNVALKALQSSPDFPKIEIKQTDTDSSGTVTVATIHRSPIVVLDNFRDDRKNDTNKTVNIIILARTKGDISDNDYQKARQQLIDSANQLLNCVDRQEIPSE